MNGVNVQKHVEEELKQENVRNLQMEQDVKAMPGAGDLHRVELSLSGIAGDMKAMSASLLGMHESLKRTENAVSRHEEHLRGQGQ